MENLYLAYLGGRLSGGHIEMHDVRFVHGETIRATYGQLKQQWVGNKQGAHLDAYIRLHHIDGYQITLSTEPSPGPWLYFVNFGGYHAQQLAELHQFFVVVAESPENAKQRAWQKLQHNRSIPWLQAHLDDLKQVDDCFAISLIDSPYYIHLNFQGAHLSQSQPLQPDWYGFEKL
ncbi:DUF1543 domain-containing protein [Motilimonas eburnea]|uniref:DUF1543 domain-containing protein n=1 Tax=Motilimonas eburnea TaxID=1737488 RepID=UPI001E5AA149|nr:DUF1543 domain-containing protein [Motilimonas eburnea]MCE2572736.1 DUF1543 domain-containing protein [Motilimonas eburnea]